MADTAKPGSVFLLDTYGLIFQLFHAIPAMTGPDGRPVNILYGFTRDLMTLLDRKPGWVVCAMDGGGPTFRSDLAPTYKAHRPPMPSDLELQIPAVRELVGGFNVPCVGAEGFEADDVIATLARRAEGLGLDVFICTTDKDCRQLITEKVKMLNLRKNIVLDKAALLADWGVAPEQVVDYQSLVGDSVDNIPGVAGVGAKTATKLLQQFGSVDAMLARVGEVKPPRIQTNLKAAAEDGTLRRARELVTLRADVPLETDWDAWKLRGWDGQKLLELFQRFGFRRYAEQVRESLKGVGAAKNAAVLAVAGGGGQAELGGLFAGPPLDAKPADKDAGEAAEPEGDLFDGDELFAFGANAEADTWQADYSLVDTPEKFTDFLAELRRQKRFAVDLETTGLDPLRADIVGLSFCWSEGRAFYLPVKAPEGDAVLPAEATLSALKPLLEDAKIAKVNQNIKFDALALRRHGVRLAGVAGDSMVAHYLLHSGERSHSLDDLARAYLKHENIPITDLIGKRGKNQLTIDQVPTEKVRDYAAEDADVAWRLTGLLEAELDAKPELRKLYDELEVPLVEVLTDIEATGVRLDTAYLARLSEQMTAQLTQTVGEIHAIAGREFNIASLKQLREVLFDQLKLPIVKRTELTGEPSTDQETLERLAALGHALPKKIVEYRQVSKLKGTYVDALPELVNPHTGRLHTSFNQTVTSTGRLSSSEPNLQNIPTRTDQGREIRGAFLPQEGWVLLTADYSQVELRLLAHFTGDEAMRAAFAEDRDVHTSVAAGLFKVAEADVTSAQRRVAKTVNFGVIYGISPHGLAVRLGVPRDEAAKYIDEFFARHPKVLKYQAGIISRVKRDGYVGTLLGRRRRFDPGSVNTRSTYQSRNAAEREAINMEIQGSAADLMKRAMLTIHRRLRDEKREARMLLTVHDELIFEVPPAELDAVARLVREEMNRALPLSVPLKVDVSAGPNWLDTQEWRG